MSTISIPLGAASRAEVAVSAAPAAAACPSCGAGLAGDFCHACGERNPATEDRSLRHFFREVAAEFTLDSTTLRTLRLLVLQPGALTVEYLRGRRRPFVGPLRLYLVMFAAALILAALLDSGVQPQNAGGVVDALVAAVHEAIAQARGITPEEARKALNDRTLGLISWLSVLTPLLLAAFVQLAFIRRRVMFTEHLVFATHFATFNCFVGVLFLPVQLGVVARPEAVIPLGALAFALVWGYLYVALRRVYGTSRPAAAVRSLVLILGLSLAQMVTGLLALAAAALALLYF